MKVVGALAAGLIAGSTLTIVLQDRTSGAIRSTSSPEGHHGVLPRLRPEPPATVLAWVPDGMPPGFGRASARLRGIARVTVVAEDNVWLQRSWSADGGVADRPPAPFAIPIDAAGVDPRSFAAFLPPSDRSLAAALADGEGVLGATSAELRGLGTGAVMRFAGGARVRIAGVLPDELVGAAELMVSRTTGTRIGISTERYELMQPGDGWHVSTGSLTRRLRRLLPRSSGGGRVRVRMPGDTPYFRAGDAVMPPVLLKALFGEFAARPLPGRPGYLQLDPGWVRQHIVLTRVPVLGRVSCDRALVPQLRGAMQELRRRGLGSLVHSYDGCFAPRFINRIPTAMISHHTWGVAIDLNAATNPFGAKPHQDPRLVHIMERWGFIWGGSFVVPDGNHFEYRRPAPNGV